MTDSHDHSPNDSGPMIQMIVSADLPKGVEQLATHVIHCCNAMLSTDQDIESVKNRGLDALPDITNGIEHAHMLLGTVSPLLADVDEPATALGYIFASINMGVVAQYQQQMMMSMTLGQVDRAEYLEHRLDHILAVITQVFADLFYNHCATIGFGVAEGSGT